MLTASALASVWLCWKCIGRERELRQLRTAVGAVEGNRRLAQSLAAEGLEYSKRNSAIDPILEGAGVKPRSAAASTTNKPVTK